MSKNIYNNFELNAAWLSDMAASIHERGQWELVVETIDGERFLYDDLTQSVYTLASIDEVQTEEKFCRQFGRTLRRELLHKGMTQGDLAEATGLSQGLVSYYIQGKRSPSFYNIKKIADVLGCSIDYLMV